MTGESDGTNWPGLLLERDVLDQHVVAAVDRGVSVLVRDDATQHLHPADRHVVGIHENARRVREADILDDRSWSADLQVGRPRLGGRPTRRHARARGVGEAAGRRGRRGVGGRGGRWLRRRRSRGSLVLGHRWRGRVVPAPDWAVLSASATSTRRGSGSSCRTYATAPAMATTATTPPTPRTSFRDMRSPIVIVLLPSATTVGGSRSTPPLIVVIPARQLTSPRPQASGGDHALPGRLSPREESWTLGRHHRRPSPAAVRGSVSLRRRPGCRGSRTRPP